MAKGEKHALRDSKGRYAKRECRLIPVSTSGTMQSVLFEEQPSAGNEVSLIEKLLGPLKHGRPVVLAVRDPKLLKKKRVKGEPLLFLTPASCFGGDSDKLVVSLQAHGCEVLDVSEKLQSIAIHRVGLNISLCRQLADALNLVFSK